MVVVMIIIIVYTLFLTVTYGDSGVGVTRMFPHALTPGHGVKWLSSEISICSVRSEFCPCFRHSIYTSLVTGCAEKFRLCGGNTPNLTWLLQARGEAAYIQT